MIGIAHTCRSRPPGCCGDRDGWVGERGCTSPHGHMGKGRSVLSTWLRLRLGGLGKGCVQGGWGVALLLPFSIGTGDVSSVLQVPDMSEPDRDTQAGLSPGARPPPFFSLISTSRGSPISR